MEIDGPQGHEGVMGALEQPRVRRESGTQAARLLYSRERREQSRELLLSCGGLTGLGDPLLLRSPEHVR